MLKTLNEYHCDFHVHSCLSPCADITMTPGVVGKALNRKGVDWIAITDHNSTMNARSFDVRLSREGIRVIPGIEVHSSDDVHVLGYFFDLDSAESFSHWLFGKIPDVSVDPEVFGYQIYVDEEDQFTGIEEKWLGQPVSLKTSQVVDALKDAGALAVYAHVDRSMGVVYQLGGLGEDSLPVDIEVAFERSYETYSDCRRYCVWHSSDSHSPDTLAPTMKIRCESRTLQMLIEAVHSCDQERKTIVWA